MKEKTIPQIESILNRGTEDIIDRQHIQSRLQSGDTLRVKLGIDPTAPALHLGRAIPLRKLREFQDLGHTAVLIIGDFTATIGDPSDKLSKRPMLTREDVRKNMEHYLEQLGKIIDISKAEVHYNSEWLATMSAEELIGLAEAFSMQQILARRNFKDRIDSGQDVSVREALYPILQGYDSVVVKADIELGGFDQLFNLMAGRVMQKYHRVPEQDIITTQMLEGTDGRKMSASWGNVITIVDTPRDMFGKIMALRDDLITKYFLLCTSAGDDYIQDAESRMKEGTLNPRDAKLDLAEHIVALYHSAEDAEKEREYFISTFSKKTLPEEIDSISIERESVWGDFLVQHNFVTSKSEAKRLIEGGGVEVDGERVLHAQDAVREGVVKIGKSKFVKIRLQ